MLVGGWGGGGGRKGMGESLMDGGSTRSGQEGGHGVVAPARGCDSEGGLPVPSVPKSP